MFDEPVYVENHVHRIEPQPMEVGGPAAATVDYMRHHAVGLIAVLAFGEAVPESLGDPPSRVLRLVRQCREKRPIRRIEPMGGAVVGQDVRRVLFGYGGIGREACWDSG